MGIATIWFGFYVFSLLGYLCKNMKHDVSIWSSGSRLGPNRVAYLYRYLCLYFNAYLYKGTSKAKRTMLIKMRVQSKEKRKVKATMSRNIYISGEAVKCQFLFLST